jgi:hypothetical protein
MKQHVQDIDNKDIAKVHAFVEEYLKPKSFEKKQFGEVFTPLNLVREMLDAITKYADKNFWNNHDMKILDPAAGIGNFPLIAFELLMQGLKDKIKNTERRKKHILENMLYMVELNGNNVRLMNKIFNGKKYKLNIVKGDFLQDKTHDKLKKLTGMSELKFDLVMGNPPYQLGKNSNFYVKFIEKSSQILFKKALLVFLTPNRFLISQHIANSSLLKLDAIFIKHTVTDMNVNTIIGYFIAYNQLYKNKTKCTFNNNSIKLIDLHKSTPTSSSDYNVKLLSDKIIYNKFNKLQFSTTKPSGNYIFISRQWTRYSPSKTSGGNHIFDISNNEEDGSYISVTNNTHKKYLIWYLTRCKVIRFITAIYASSMNVPPFLWKSIPNLDSIRYMSDEKILKELAINTTENNLIDSFTK